MSGAVSNVVDIWNSETQTRTATTLSKARTSLSATSVGKYALFAGGKLEFQVDVTGEEDYEIGDNVVDIWNSETATWTSTTLSQRRYFLSATSVENYALFGGGISDMYGRSNVVDIWNNATNNWNTTTLSQSRPDLSATSVGKYALFGGGGEAAAGFYSNVVDIWSRNSLSWVNGSVVQLSVGCVPCTGVVVGNSCNVKKSCCVSRCSF
jgi:hypothetical protein